MPAARAEAAPKPGGGPDDGRHPAGGRRPGESGRKGGIYQRMTSGLTPKHYFITAAGLGAVLVVVLLAVLVLAAGGGGQDGRQGAAMGRPAEHGPEPSSYSSTRSTGAYAGIEQRSQDAAPLTIGEAFPERAQKIKAPNTDVELSLKAKRLDGDCAAAVWGTSIGEVLRQGACTQAVRGVYADTRKGYALTVAVFNLARKQDADRLVDGFGRGGGFLQPLPGEAPLDKVGQGFTVARGLAMGHYAVVSWTQRLDGTGNAEDETLLSLLIEGGKAPAVLGRAARASQPGS